MCGVIGCVSERSDFQVSAIISKALKRLEYRGYDSVGVATIDTNGHLLLRKDVGTIDEVNKKLQLASLPGKIGIGHTRWATHGAPSQGNAHPHMDCNKEIAVVHNGIIENYLEIRDDLKASGHRFRSETDSEVIPHLLEEYLKDGIPTHFAFQNTINDLQGTYALGVLTTHSPDRILLSRKDSPLIIGIKQGLNFAASDIPAFLEYTNKAIVLRNEEVATLLPHEIQIVDKHGRVKPQPINVSWSVEMAQKGGFPHFMLKEIHEQPDALRNTLKMRDKSLERSGQIIAENEKFYIVGCGTSYHAGLASHFQLLSLGINSIPVIASEYKSYAPLIDSESTVVAISQSGETLDTMKATKFYKNKGAKIVALSNILDSSIPRMADITIYTRAGPEIGVAATKTHTTQIAAMTLLTLSIAHQKGTISNQEYQEIRNNVMKIPHQVEGVIKKHEITSRQISKAIRSSSSAYFLSRGFGMPIAKESALKLKEIAYIHAEAYPAGESKHGPIALVEEGFPVFFYCS